MLRLALCATLTLVLTVAQVQAQAPQTQAPDPADPWAMWDVQQMIERATKEVSTRYNLTPQQQEFTRNLMVSRVNAFLDKHEAQIREIFTEVIRYQMAGQDPPADKVQAWTEQITPMFDEAKDQIVEGNREFREILSDDQKKIHDIDLKVMEQNFTDAEKRLDRWRDGGFDAEKDLGRKPTKSAASKPLPPPAARPNPPVVKAPASAPAIPPAAGPAPTGTAGKPTIVGPGPVAPASMDAWEIYVDRFIANYALDKTQASQARGILADSKKRAEEYRASRKVDYQRAEAQIASDPKNAAAQTQMKDLNKPIDLLFAEMKQRLEQIPTDAQRKAYEQSRPAQVKGREQDTAGKAVQGPTTQSTQPARPVAGRPTDTQPVARNVKPSPRVAASQPAAQR